MTDLSVLKSSLFETDYITTARVIMSYDVVHRKNRSYAIDALKKSGFAKFMVNLLKELPDDCIQQVFEDQLSVGYDSVDDFCSSFLSSKCKHYVNFHDEKLCTVEFTCKIVTTLGVVTSLSEELVNEFHLDIQTPVGSVQL